MGWFKRKNNPIHQRARWEVEVESLADGNQISCRVTNSILKYLAVMGFDPARAVEGLPFSREYLEDPFNWVNCNVRDELTARAKAITGDDDFMFHLGLESARLGSVGGVEQMIRLLASPRMVYRLLPHYAKFFDRTCDFRVSLSGPNRANVTLVWSTAYPVTKDRCRYTQGMLMAIPKLWDLPPAALVEKSCGCDIHKAASDAKGETVGGCVYEISWTPLPSFIIRSRQSWKTRWLGKADPTAELERNFHLLDLKNSQLRRRNKQLTGVRDLALAIGQTGHMERMLDGFPALVTGITGIVWVMVLNALDQGDVLQVRSTGAASNISREGIVVAGAGRVQRRVTLSEFGQPAPGENPEPTRAVELDAARVSALDQAGFVLPEAPGAGRRVILAPVMVQTHFWGINVFGVDEDVPTDILEMCSAHLATGIQAHSLLKSIEARSAELSALNSVAHSLASTLDFDQLLGQAAQATARAFRAGVSIHLLDEDKTQLVMHSHSALQKEAAESLARVPLEGSSFGHFLTSRGMGEDGIEDSRVITLKGQGAGPLPWKYRHIMALLRAEGRSVGVLTVFRGAGDDFSSNDFSLLRSIGNQLSMALDNALLNQDAHRRLEEAETARADLQQTLDRQLEFNRILVHEVKTPLTSVLACSELMRSELEGEAARSLGGLIELSARNLNQRVDELSDLSLGELGKLRIHPIATDLLEIVKEVFHQMAPLARERHQLFSMDLPDDLDYVMAEEGRVRQVLVSLLGNAFRNTPAGGNVVIRVRREGDQACVAVEDTGRGIPEDTMKWLFDPYHRRSGDRDRLGGLGLGLTLSRYIVELHGGSLKVESAPGAGTTVSFILPLASACADREAEPADAVSPTG